MRSGFIALFMIAAVSLSGQASRGSAEMSFEGQSVDGMVASFMGEQGVSGISLAIVQAPYITRATGYGLADAQSRLLVSHNTLFDVAGMKNAYTAVAVLQLVESGALRLDDALRAKLADPAAYPELETLVGKTAGTSYEDFVRENQFERLGLRQTFFGDAITSRREELRPGDRHRAFLSSAALIDPVEPATGYRGTSVIARSASGLYASATDVSIWDIGLAGGILIGDPELRKLVYVPETLANGRRAPSTGTWWFPGHEGLMIVTGSGAGFSSLLSRFTKSDELVCVTLLANREGVDLTQLARRIAGAHNARLGPPSRAQGKRVQESPYTLAETRTRIARELSSRDLAANAVVWQEGTDVWVAVDDVADPKRRAAIDAALLAAVMP
jgi:D-alanyl-D-alanine carboxypeptidase